jgi:hypothetical protein
MTFLKWPMTQNDHFGPTNLFIFGIFKIDPRKPVLWQFKALSTGSWANISPHIRMTISQWPNALLEKNQGLKRYAWSKEHLEPWFFRFWPKEAWVIVVQSWSMTQMTYDSLKWLFDNDQMTFLKVSMTQNDYLGPISFISFGIFEIGPWKPVLWWFYVDQIDP